MDQGYRDDTVVVWRCTCERVNGRITQVEKDCGLHGYAGQDAYWSEFWKRLASDGSPGWK